jgi:succinyl-CoA synthetase beta subunit
MKLYEHQGRELFARQGIPVPDGVVVSSLDELEEVRDDVPLPCVVKAQVLAGGRGKAGGIKFADTWDEVEEHVDELLGSELKGYTVHDVLLVEKLEFEEELYASVILDRSRRSGLAMLSQEGGVDIESVPEEKIAQVPIDPLVGFQPFHFRRLGEALDLPDEVTKQVRDVFETLADTFFASDARLLEINPLAVTPEGVVAGDSKVVLDDSALYRHDEVERVTTDKSDLEIEAEEKGISFVDLEGDIGVIANGAGLTMATLDAIKQYGGEGGVFLDLGGTDSTEKVRQCFELMAKAQPRVVLLNLFGGITKCDTVARGVREVLETEDIDFEVVTRIKGVNEEEAREILRDAGLPAARDLEEAAQKTVEVRDKEVA